jgi:hypothetical protein
MMQLRASSNVKLLFFLFIVLFIVAGVLTASGVATGIAAKQASLHREGPGAPAPGWAATGGSRKLEPGQRESSPTPSAAPQRCRRRHLRTLPRGRNIAWMLCLTTRRG